MSKNITFIINPASGFGRTKRRLKELYKEINAQVPQSTILLTRHAFHGTSLAKDSLRSGAKRLVVIGGDGTLNEVVNGYFDKEGRPHNPDAALAIIPSGTGSDFVRNFNQPRALKEALDFAINSSAKLTDVGKVEAHDEHESKIERYFINVSSLGLSGLVAGFMKTVTKKLGGKGAYFLATVQAIRALKPPTLQLSFGDIDRTFDNCSLISVGNGKYFGSGMKISPNAELDDGLLDVVTIQDLSAMFFLINGFRVYQGTHLALANVHEFHRKECIIKAISKEPVYIETDGELFAKLPAKYSILPKTLWMVR